ncbi:PQQ-binding-like beta-propeller repeat protein, partial [Streptomyces sp. NPDC058662]|uniref:outer membrane protein assembly factor BamB family protein n=1 Tax=Streptomyces sp. NPDC058662 TaxID=3346583 RepID=UPI00365FA523
RRSALWAAGLGLLLAAGAAGGYAWSGPDAEASARPGTPGAPTPRGTAAGKPFTPWSVPLGGRTASCSAAAGGLYCSGRGLAAARLDPADGSVVWAVRTAAPAPDAVTDSTPLHAAGAVLAVAPGSELLQALDPGTGAERWRRGLPGGARVVTAGPYVLTVAPDGAVTALDAASGAQRWTKRIGGAGSVWWGGPGGSGAPVLYAATPDGAGATTLLAEVDPATGAVVRQTRAAGRLRPVGVAGGSVYLLDNEAGVRTSAVVRVDAASLAVHRVRLSAPLFEAEAAVAPDGTVYAVESRGGLVAVGPEGERWRLETGAGAASRPVAADGRVHLSAQDGRLLTVDAAAGRLTGQTGPRTGPGQGAFSATLPAPVAADGRVYASAPDGSVFAVAAVNPAGD